MYISTLSLTNFKNYSETQIEFHERINCIVGNNGVGKTNILDAIHYLSLTKSYFNNIDSANILHGTDFFIINGRFFVKDQTTNIICSVQKQKQKIFKCNSKEYNKLSDHIGKFPVVMVSPSDQSIVLDGSEIRRKFINKIISQFDAIYLDAAINYDKALRQRNNLLKKFAIYGGFDEEQLQIWDLQLARYGDIIYATRKELIEQLIPSFQYFYSIISDSKENVSLSYRSDAADNSILDMLNQSLERDKATRYTTVGVHRDDLILKMDGYPIKNICSQGQQKTYLTALKLAKYEYIKNKTGIKPILLLDDIFDKFDSQRVKKILQIVMSDNFGQIFITDTKQERFDAIFNTLDNYKIITIN